MAHEEKILKGLKEMHETAKWLNKGYSKIRERYGGRYIELGYKKILASHRKIDSLFKEIEKQGRDPTENIIEYVPKPGEDIIYSE